MSFVLANCEKLPYRYILESENIIKYYETCLIDIYKVIVTLLKTKNRILKIAYFKSNLFKKRLSVYKILSRIEFYLSESFDEIDITCIEEFLLLYFLYIEPQPITSVVVKEIVGFKVYFIKQ